MIFIDPVTQQRVVYQKHSGDIQYLLTGDTAISKETVPVIGNWSDYTGSAIVNSRTQQMTAGMSNEFQGEDPGIEGEKLPALNEIGQRSQTTRRRTILRRVNPNGRKD